MFFFLILGDVSNFFIENSILQQISSGEPFGPTNLRREHESKVKEMKIFIEVFEISFKFRGSKTFLKCLLYTAFNRIKHKETNFKFFKK